VLDISLGGKMSCPATDLLAKRRVPFLFATGYQNATNLTPNSAQALMSFFPPALSDRYEC